MTDEPEDADHLARPRATVEAVVFRGDHDQVRVALAPGVQLETVVTGRPVPEVGSTVLLAIDPAGVRVLGPAESP